MMGAVWVNVPPSYKTKLWDTVYLGGRADSLLGNNLNTSYHIESQDADLWL